MQAATYTWQGPADTRLHARHWAVTDPRAVVALVHGIGEHTGRYDHVGAYLQGKGIALMGSDLIGHGRSTGKRGHVGNYEHLLDQIDVTLTEARAYYPEAPVFLYGHSMGGNLVLNYLLSRRPDGLAGVIASAPQIKLAFEPPKLILGVARLLRSVLPAVTRDTELKVEHISRDPEVVARYQADELVHGDVSFNLAVSLLNRSDYIQKDHSPLSAPLLLMHGTADQITSPDGSRELAEKAQGDVMLKLWDGLYHEIHNEPEQLDVLDYAHDWMVGRM